MTLEIVVAMTESGVIGKDGRLPWRIKEEMQHFKRLTVGHAVVMGRLTYESIGHPLSARHNVVISSNLEQKEGLYVCNSFNDAVRTARGFSEKVFVIGGVRVFEAALEAADKMHVSRIKNDYVGDVFFPEYDKSKWLVEQVQDFDEFVYWEYKKA